MLSPISVSWRVVRRLVVNIVMSICKMLEIKMVVFRARLVMDYLVVCLGRLCMLLVRLLWSFTMLARRLLGPLVFIRF